MKRIRREALGSGFGSARSLPSAEKAQPMLRQSTSSTLQHSTIATRKRIWSMRYVTPVIWSSRWSQSIKPRWWGMSDSRESLSRPNAARRAVLRWPRLGCNRGDRELA